MPGVSSPFLEIFGDIMVPFLWWCWKPQPQHSRQLGPDDFRITVTPCDWESPWLTNVDLTGVNKKQTITRALGGTTISWMCKECVSHTHINHYNIYIYYITYIFFDLALVPWQWHQCLTRTWVDHRKSLGVEDNSGGIAPSSNKLNFPCFLLISILKSNQILLISIFLEAHLKPLTSINYN